MEINIKGIEKMKKINKKDVYIFIAAILFISSQILPKAVNNLDEIWNFNFARCISNRINPI